MSHRAAKHHNSYSIVKFDVKLEGNLHERVVDAHDKDLSRLADLGVVDIAGDVARGAGGRKGGGHADDDAVGDAGPVLLGQAHLVGGRVLVQFDVGDWVAHLDENAGRAVEKSTGSSHGHGAGGGGHSSRARHGRGDAAKSAEGHVLTRFLDYQSMYADDD